MKKIAGDVIIMPTWTSLLYLGILLFNMGMFLDRIAPLYIERGMRINPLPYEKKIVKIIGRNMSTFDAVSIMMTTRPKVIRVAPERTAAAPKIAMIYLVAVSLAES